MYVRQQNQFCRKLTDQQKEELKNAAVAAGFWKQGDPYPFSGQPGANPDSPNTRITFEHYQTDPPRFAYLVHYGITLTKRPNVWLKDDPYLVPAPLGKEMPFFDKEQRDLDETLSLHYTMARVLGQLSGFSGQVPRKVSVCGWSPPQFGCKFTVN